MSKEIIGIVIIGLIITLLWLFTDYITSVIKIYVPKREGDKLSIGFPIFIGLYTILLAVLFSIVLGNY